MFFFYFVQASYANPLKSYSEKYSPEKNKGNLLGQWLNFKLFGITYLVGKIKFKLFFFRVQDGWVRKTVKSSKELMFGRLSPTFLFQDGPFFCDGIFIYWWFQINWAVLSDEQMSNGYPFSLLNDEQMSNKVGVKHQPVNFTWSKRSNLTTVIHVIPSRSLT